MSSSLLLSRSPISRQIAMGAVVLLWMIYTTLQTLTVTGQIPEQWYAILGFLPGILGVAVLRAAGLAWGGLFLRMAPLSRRGFAVLAGVFIFALAAILPFGEWHGWNWEAALLYAPASGVSQELFFRAVLLPAFLLALKHQPRLSLVLHSLLFGLWHIGPLFLGAPIWAVVAVMLVPFMSGIGWGWQVKYDKTVFWAMLQHTLIWVIAGQFPMPA